MLLNLTTTRNFTKQIFKTPDTNRDFVGCQSTLFTSQPWPG